MQDKINKKKKRKSGAAIDWNAGVMVGWGAAD
jgi:hypothetical protein